MSQPTLGFVGLGRMGAGMARNLLAAGHPLLVHDANADAVASLAADGATAADSPAAIASQAELLFLCLPFAPEVRAVLFDDGGAAQGAREGLRVIDCTTLIRADAVEIAARAAEFGIRYNDCPVSGGPKGAAEGTLTIMFGGETGEFETLRPLLACMGREVVHCGPLGSGQLMKAVNNVIYDVNIAAFCEVLPLAVKAGLDVQTLTRVVTSGSSRSFASEHFVPRILDGRFDADFTMRAAWKDIVNLQQEAVRHGAMTPVVNAMTAVYQTAIAQGHGDAPKSAMIKVYEQILGTEFRKRSPP